MEQGRGGPRALELRLSLGKEVESNKEEGETLVSFLTKDPLAN